MFQVKITFYIIFIYCFQRITGIYEDWNCQSINHDRMLTLCKPPTKLQCKDGLEKCTKQEEKCLKGPFCSKNKPTTSALVHLTLEKAGSTTFKQLFIAQSRNTNFIFNTVKTIGRNFFHGKRQVQSSPTLTYPTIAFIFLLEFYPIRSLHVNVQVYVPFCVF